jgi:hypothetical protein
LLLPACPEVKSVAARIDLEFSGVMLRLICTGHAR